jgi:hypothetical protein
VQQSGGAQRAQYKLEVSSAGDSAEVEADRAAAAMVDGAAAAVGGAPTAIAREEEGATCNPENASCVGEDGKEKEGEGVGAAGEQTLKICGIELGIKAGSEGAEVSVAKQLTLPSPSFPLGNPAVLVVIEPKVGVTGKVKYTKEGGWSGELALALEVGAYVRGGLPWAYVQGGCKMTLNLSPHLAGGFNVSGDLEGALLVSAAAKIPFTEGSNMKEPEGWKSAGGVNFELVLAKAKLVHIVMTPGESHISYIGPDLSSHYDALKAWQDEYQRNVEGGGEGGGRPSYPTAPPTDDGDE